MSDQKHKMPADGSGTSENGRLLEGQLASENDQPSARHPKEIMRGSPSENRKFKGGQSNQAYHGSGQLGEDREGASPNAPSEEE